MKNKMSLLLWVAGVYFILHVRCHSWGYLLPASLNMSLALGNKRKVKEKVVFFHLKVKNFNLICVTNNVLLKSFRFLIISLTKETYPDR
jgi:hypothetical protein